VQLGHHLLNMEGPLDCLPPGITEEGAQAELHHTTAEVDRLEALHAQMRERWEAHKTAATVAARLAEVRGQVASTIGEMDAALPTLRTSVQQQSVCLEELREGHSEATKADEDGLAQHRTSLDAAKQALGEHEVATARISITRDRLAALLESQGAMKASLEQGDSTVADMTSEASVQGQRIEKGAEEQSQVGAMNTELKGSLDQTIAELNAQLDQDDATLHELQGLEAKLHRTASKAEVAEFAKDLESVQSEIDGVLSEVEGLQGEKDAVLDEAEELVHTNRSQLVQCEEGFKQTLAEVARWRQEVDAKVAPLEVADRKFRPLLQSEHRKMQLEEERRQAEKKRRQEEAQRKKVINQTRGASTVDHKAEATRIAAALKSKAKK